MYEKLMNYNYPKTFILVETNEYIYKKLSGESEILSIDDYLWQIVTTVSEQSVNGKKYYLIQHEDKEVGWIALSESIQILRFPAKHYKIIEDKFINNDLNKKLNMNKDFTGHFTGKLLNVKSEIEYEDNTYYGVFIKDRFQGFHDAEMLDPVIECATNLNDYAEDIKLYMISSLAKPVDIDLTESNIKLVQLFKKNKIGKVTVDDDKSYWISLEDIPQNIYVDLEDNKSTSDVEKVLDDIMMSVNTERKKSRQMVKTLLDAKKMFDSKKFNSMGLTKKNIMKSEEYKYMKDLANKFKKETKQLKEKSENLKSELDVTKVSLQKKKKLNLDYEKRLGLDNKKTQEMQDLKKDLSKSSKEKELVQKRLNHQIDYNKRLEKQKEKYKKRMEVVEEKLQELDRKYKKIRDGNDKNQVK